MKFKYPSGLLFGKRHGTGNCDVHESALHFLHFCKAFFSHKKETLFLELDLT